MNLGDYEFEAIKDYDDNKTGDLIITTLKRVGIKANEH